ncbi:MAG: HI0074 family nucleotidyltransferase substrate-binding subunit [Legionellales bacterium]|nr:HI0074 family nucleotidyltransferase substrate-binding subunit [Legionellales bacterium]
MSLDFSALSKAILQLQKSLEYVNSPMAQQNAGLREQFRNSVIQCFEFTYELSHKMLKRYLEATVANPEEIDLSTFQHLIRLGNEKGLLRSDWNEWRTYRQARTDSTHTYDEEKAEEVFAITPDFLEEARYLLQTLTKRSKTP